MPAPRGARNENSAAIARADAESGLHALVYVSAFSGEAHQSDLTDILQQARRNNRALDITGLLLFHDGNFLQVLEGPRRIVLDCYRRIAADRRHRGCCLLMSEPIARRRCAGWDMAFIPHDALSPELRAGFIDLQRIDESDGLRGLGRDRKVRIFLETFFRGFRDLAPPGDDVPTLGGRRAS